MRTGNNPEKEKNNKNTLKPHRVLMVFYIPDSNEDYYKELDVVLDKSLESLINTINLETTAITLINNNSSKKVDAVVEKYKPYLDKYVLYTENKGKVYAILNEVRGVFEPYVTITDADILFYSGWENEVFDIFRKIPKVGVVSPMPMPYLTLHFNQSIFFNTLWNRIKYGKFVSDEDIDLYVTGTNLPKIIERRAKFNWKEKQYLYTENECEVIVGAYHVVSTYRTEQFRNIYSFPEFKFLNSYESDYIDCLADKKGLYRVSTQNTFAYHIGNKIDDVVEKHQYDSSKVVKPELINGVQEYKEQYNFSIFIKRIIGRIFIKFLWNR